MVQNNNTRIMRKVLYALKQQYEEIVDIYTPGASSVDFSTGSQTIPYTPTRCSRTIVMEATISTLAKFSQTVQGTTKPTISGGYLNTGDRIFIFDAKDLPKDFQFSPDQYLVFNHIRYEVKDIQTFGKNIGYMVVATETRTTPPNEINVLSVYDYIVFSEESGGIT